MTIPSKALPQANKGAPQVDPTGENKKKPIEAGVDSHKIEFHLGSTHTKKVETVVGASFDPPIDNDFLTGLAPRLRELATNGSTLVSFGSTTSFERLAQQDKPTPLHRDSTSLIERVKASVTSNRGNGLKLSDKITVLNLTITSRGTNTAGIPYLEGEIEIKSADPQVTHKTIKFLEFSPKYDGRSLDENTLLNALQHVSNKTADGAAVAHPHFYSMNGIGRSASLAVLYSFKKMCEQKENGFNQGEVEGHLNSLIDHGRQQRNACFVNTAAQKKELLNACISLNQTIVDERKPTMGAQPKQDFQRPTLVRKPPKPAAAIASTTAPPKTIVISKAIEKLATDIPTSISNPRNLPYMPIKLQGITKIANDSEKFPFPQVDKEQAKVIAKDIILAGFYGDALGADLETKIYPDKKNILFRNMSNEIKKTFRDASSDIQRDQLLIQQLKQNHGRKSEIRHQATDDTQQGVLSANVKMRCMLNGESDLNELAKQTMQAFHKPRFPSKNQNPNEKPNVDFDIRGGANTYYMCKFTDPTKNDWREVAIEDIAIKYDQSRRAIDISKQGVRAGGAGNGGLMRIGYDLLPLLASGASMQDLVEQALISNQVTHPSSFSAVASVGQVVLMAKCIDLRINAEKEGEPLIVPPNFFIDTFHQVAEALEHPDQKFGLLPGFSLTPEKYSNFTTNEWRSKRLPSEFLKGSNASTEAVKAGSVEQALKENPKTEKSSKDIDSVLQRWSSNSYLGATFPSIVFLLEKFAREDPAHAVNMAALVTKDSDTCATIIAQVMGALYGSEWVDKARENCKNSQGQSTFSENLGGGFEVTNFLSHINNFYDQRANPRPR